MKLAILAGASALALSACAGLEAQTGLTPTEQTCAVTEGAAYATSITEWADLTYSQKGAVVAAGVDEVVATCGIESPLVDQARPIISAAIQAAALVED